MRGFLILLGLAALLLPGRAEEQAVQKFDGTNSTTTPTFTVADHWEVSWQSPAPLRITLLTPDGTIVAGTAGMFRGSLYQARGGKYYFQVEGSHPGPTAPWQLSVIQMGEASPDSSPLAQGAFNFVPPRVKPPAAAGAGPSPANAAPAPVAEESPAPAAVPTPDVPAAPVQNLTAMQTDAVVMIEGDNGEGTGFLVKTPDGPVVITNLHVISANPHLHILTNVGRPVTVLGLKGATDRDLAMFSIRDDGFSYLTLDDKISDNVQNGDDVVTPGNSQGGEVVLATHGTVLGVGPQRIEFSNPIYHGNSGGPVFHTKTGKVVGVVTEAVKIDTDNDLDRASFGNRASAIRSSMRYFALRVDTVPKWETYDPTQFQTQTAFLDEFHQQSRRLDSYLNSEPKDDFKADDSGESNGPPSSRYYLTDDRIVKAQTDFTTAISGADASQRLDACREWVFSFDALADINLGQIQNMGNFYTFEQQRAREEIDYRRTLRQEIESVGDDISRIQYLSRRN